MSLRNQFKRTLPAVAALLVALLLLGMLAARWLTPKHLVPGTCLFPWEQQDLSSISLQRGDETLRLAHTPNGRGWIAEGAQNPADETLNALLEFLHALRIEFPYTPAENDTVLAYLQRSGLSITLSNAHGDSLSYTLGMWLDGRIIAHGKGFYYTAQAPGYFAGILHTLDLDAKSWSERRLWHGEPSSLQELQLVWIDDPKQSFRIKRTVENTLLLFDGQGQRAHPFDSLRMATLLYALADLPYDPLPDSISQHSQHNALAYPPYIRIELKSSTDTGAYTLFRMPKKQGKGLDPNRAILQLAQERYLVQLVKWDAALARLEDLQ